MSCIFAKTSAKRRRASRPTLGDHPMGFTLIETVVSMLILSVLFLVIGSAFVIAAKAMPQSNSPIAQTKTNAAALYQMSQDMQMAIYLTQRTGTSITMVLPDRDDDGLYETVRYAWDGSAGSSLTRTYNNLTDANFLTQVNAFALTYQTTTETQSFVGPDVQSSEQLFSYYLQVNNWKTKNVESDKFYSQFINPSLPANALSWQVGRVVMMLSQEGSANEDTYFQLRTPDNGGLNPSGTIVQQQIVSESDLPSFLWWTSISFNNTVALAPGQDVCLVLAHQGSGGKSAKVMYDDDNPGYTFQETDDAGDTWSDHDNNSSLLYYLYGTYTTPGITQTLTHTFTTGIDIQLQAGQAGNTALASAVTLKNQPQVLSSIWELNFKALPNLVDLNNDGTADWQYTSNGGGLNIIPGMTSEAWPIDGTLKTTGNQNFEGITTVKLKMQHTSQIGQGPSFAINLDRLDAVGQLAQLTANLQLQVDDTQTLTIGHTTNVGVTAPLLSVTGLDNDFVELTLVIDTHNNQIAVWQEENYLGAFTYTLYSDSNAPYTAKIFSDNEDVQVKYLSIAAGGSIAP